MKKNLFYPLALIAFVLLTFTQCSTTKKTASEDSPSKKGAPAQSQSNADSKTEPEDALAGAWTFDYFTMVNTSTKILFPLQQPALNFETKGSKFSGNSGCNSISGMYSRNGNNLTFKQPMIMTRMSCNSMGEKTLLEYLKAVTRFNINGNSLELITDSKPVMIFKRAVK